MNTITARYKKVTFKKKEISVSFTVNKTYKRIWEIARDFNANVPPRKGFGFLDSGRYKKETAVWCVNLDDDSLWEDILTDNGNTLVVRKSGDKTPLNLQERIRKSPDIFNVEIKRLTFAKTRKNGEYMFLGVFKLSAIDFDNQSLIFRRVAGNKVTITQIKKQKIVLICEEETMTVI